jgi:hypothetical protein
MASVACVRAPRGGFENHGLAGRGFSRSNDSPLFQTGTTRQR